MGYITDKLEYEKITELMNSCRNWSLEECQSDFKNCYYFVWDLFSVRGFFPFIKELARLSSDECFYFYDIFHDPKTVIEYYDHFLKYPVIKFSQKTTEDEYFKLLNEEPGQIDEKYFMVAVTSHYAIFPPSMNWYVYGTYEIELGKLVTKVGLPKEVPFPYNFLSKKEAKRLIHLLDEN